MHVFWVWVISTLRIKFPSPINQPAKFMMSLFLLAKQQSIVQINHIFCIHFSVDRYLGCFLVWTIMNKGDVNIVVHSSLGYGIASCAYDQKWYNWVFRQNYFSVKLPHWFPEWFYKFTTLSVMEECFLFSTTSPACAVT